MRGLIYLAIGCAVIVGAGAASASAETIDEAAAIAAAKKYTKGRCTATPCTYTARREGRQWNVWVEFTKRHAPGEKPRPYAGGHVILYFDAQGHLVRRIEGQ